MHGEELAFIAEDSNILGRRAVDLICVIKMWR